MKILKEQEKIYDVGYCEHDTGENDGGWDGPACYNDSDTSSSNDD